MRKALIGIILAATAMTPVAAWAQDEDGGRSERIRQRMEQREQARGERQEARTERRVEQTEVRQQRSEPQVQQAPASMQSRAVNARGERNLQRAVDGGGAVADQNRQEWRRDRREDRQDSRQDRQDWQRNRQNDGSQTRQEWQRRGEWRDGRDGRSDGRYEGRNDGRYDGRSSQYQRRDWRRNWDRNSWRNDRRYDWQNWRSRNRNIFRTSPYYSPYRNHRYSRFSIGVFLEPLFYGRNYWIGDPYQYRLPYAPPGTQWVRYYNDVLLVDTWSGEVVDVIYNFFW